MLCTKPEKELTIGTRRVIILDKPNLLTIYKQKIQKQKLYKCPK